MALLIFVSTSPSAAQYGAVIQACSRDVVRYCAPSQPGKTG